MSKELTYEITETQLNHMIKLSQHPMELVDYLIKLKKSKSTGRAKKLSNKAYVDKMVALSEVSKKFRQQLIKNQTYSEKQFKAILKSCGVKYDFQYVIYNKSKEGKSFYIVDFYLPSVNCVIEIDGGYHYKKEAIAVDRLRTKVLQEQGITQMYRFKNEDVSDPDYCIKKINSIIDGIKSI